MSESDPKKSHFFKRMQKDNPSSTANEGAPVEAPVADEYPHKALDVLQTPDGYKAIEIVYNLETGRAKVSQVKNSSRLVGLSFDEKKRALRTLSKL